VLPDARRVLLCRVRARCCAVPIADVIETMRPLPLERLTSPPPFVRGLAIIRGAPVPVVDVGALLGASEPARPTRFVTIRTGARSLALSVEEVVGIREISATRLVDLPPLLREASQGVLDALGVLDAELLVVLDAVRAIPASDWASIARADEGGGR
jgi:purine-binding chemotaxis protein CheW